MDEVTIYHNPRCSKSRQTLALIRERGIEPTIVLYLDNVPSQSEIKELLAKLGLGARDILRTGEADYKAHIAPLPTLDDATLDDVIIALMTHYPKLIERPIVTYGDKAVIGRPPEAVLTLL
ncbi:arsenate reductase (glutaredoxin) [Candidatus Puniceispirillum marinum]|jgi:arsenate reductase|uniref:Arsenate reductase n=1 Tax=Puniceispirillum marinum (strain IMCC1322) TaxID=488538 RepID=D5BTV2_PUNMI|nr:arsenate reductase (glutaredoxin) [Candidatus Puniceispirillum marinum]ADE39699.1 arsenate reductase [Candidatus Puniceispirillum marinum IMCC1322]